MIWLTGIVSIAFMLAILSIHPQELAVISTSVTSEQWQVTSYVLLSLVVLLCIIIQLFKRRLSTQNKVLSQSTCAKSQLLTPTRMILKQGVIIPLVRGLGLLVFLLAVITSTLAQRVSLLEKSPKQSLYVEAVVTPIGLSDRLLTVNIVEDANAESTAVVQGYRQLVRLTNIKPYVHFQDRGNTAGGGTASVNPFYIPDNRLNRQDNRLSIDSDSIIASDNEGVTTAKSDAQKKVKNEAKSNLAERLNVMSDITDIESYSNERAANRVIQQKPVVNANAIEHDKKIDIGISDYHELPSSMTVLLSSYNIDDQWLNELSPDKVITLRLKLEPIEFTDAGNGFNEYRWLSTRHATALAHIIRTDLQGFDQIKNLTTIQKIANMRYQFRQHFLSLIKVRETKIQEMALPDNQVNSPYVAIQPNINNHDHIAVTLSLLTGDRSLISSEMTGRYRFAGISHLLAISGAHVLFLAVLSATIATTAVNYLYPSLYRILPRWQLSFVIAVAVAFMYALFAGFDIPAIRTALMLVVIGVVRYSLAASSVFKVLLVIALAMAWQDIYVLWQAGFWLSFIAVVVLIIYTQRWGYVKEINTGLTPLSLVDNQQETSKISTFKALLVSYLKLQLWMSIALLPISLWLFGKVSLWGLLVNIFAIGLFGWLIVPLNLLAGLVYTIWADVADMLWRFIFQILDTFHHFLFLLQSSASQTGWLYTDISLPLLFLIIMAVLPWIISKGVLSHLYSIPPITVLMFLPFIAKEQSEQLTRIIPIEMSSNQLSATLVTNTNYNWLLLSAYPNSYDTDVILLETQLFEASKSVYDSLKNHQVRHLTGVVVQTATPELAFLVAKIRQDMPISYYWQAGLEHSQEKVDGYLKKVPLTPQSCKKGSLWQLNHNTSNNLIGEFDKVSLMAISGWPEIDDSQVWDCTLQMDSKLTVGIEQNNGLKLLSNQETEVSDVVNANNINNINKNLGIDDARINQSALEAKKNTKGNNQSTSFIFYTSPQPRHAKLWQSMCHDPVFATTNTISDRFYGSLENKHWLLTAKSYADVDLIDSMQPISLDIVDKTDQSVPSTMKEVELYWQQNYLKSNHAK